MRTLALLMGLALIQPAAGGGYEAAVDVFVVHDGERGYGVGGRSGRPIRVFLWYPASRDGLSQRVTLQTYAEADWISASHSRTGWEEPAGARSEFERRLRAMSPAIDAQQISRLYGTSSGALWRAPAASGRFPLVIINSGAGARVYHHAALAEHLARAGFVVAQVASLGPEPGAALMVDAASVTVVVQDTLVLIEHLRSDRRVSADRIGLIGWSVGGVTQLRLTAFVREIAAMVSLDSGASYDYGPPMLASVGGKANALKVPYLHLAAGVPSSVPRDHSLLTELGADVQVMPGLTHAQFTSLGVAAGGLNPLEMTGLVERFLSQHLRPGVQSRPH